MARTEFDNKDLNSKQTDNEVEVLQERIERLEMSVSKLCNAMHTIVDFMKREGEENAKNNNRENNNRDSD